MNKIKTNEEVKELLNNYENYKTMLKYYEEELEILTTENVEFFSKISNEVNVDGSKKFISDYEKLEIKKNSLKRQIYNLKKLIKKIDFCLNIMRNVRNFEIIEEKYFNKLPIDKILNKFYISKSNYHFFHKKLINKFKIVFNKLE